MSPRLPRSAAAALALFAVVLVCSATRLPAADSYKIDGAHTFVTFRINHLGIGEAFGRFDDVSGSFEVDGGKPKSVNLEIEAESVDTANADRDKHLKSPDFFNTKQFPVVKFESKSVEKHGDHFEVAGDLTMLGVTKPMNLKLKQIGEGEDPWGNYRTGWLSEFTVKRSNFGMKYMLEGLGDEVTVVVSVEGIKQ